MAFLPIQRGALVDRLRRFLGVVGPFSGKVDETLAATVLAADLSAQPYDTNAERFVASTFFQSDGTQPDLMALFRNETNTLVVIDEILARSSNNFQLMAGDPPFPLPGVLGHGVSRDRVTKHGATPTTPTGLNPSDVAIGIYHQQAAGSSRAKFLFQGVAAVPYQIRQGIVLVPGEVVQMKLTPPIQSSQNIFLTAWGRIMNDPSLNVPG